MSTTYARSASLYDLLHRGKDYRREIDYVRTQVRTRRPQARSLLDVACGTGNHLAGLQQDFDVEGLDRSAEMLALARSKFPRMRLHEADMTGFDLGRRYDVVCCLFRSIAFARTPAGLHAAVAAMARHLEPGGLLMLEPFFTPETFWVGRVTLHEVRSDDRVIAWMYSSDREGAIGYFRNHYLIGGVQGIEHFAEDHALGLFRRADFESAFAAVGLALEFEPAGPSGLGLYIGRAAGGEAPR